MHDLTAFQRDLLFVVGGLETPKGLEIRDELQKYYDDEVHHGRLYPNLDKLVTKGLVDKGKHNERSNYYTLTRRGRREIEDRRQWEQRHLEGRAGAVPT
ncbi:PadR family transcriptional regulator [Halobacteriales archaeon QS_8_69_26]|nr:MAG: PadR family transcriptional regulator [Halobacteriales archaeon QS_8_69_26]